MDAQTVNTTARDIGGCGNGTGRPSDGRLLNSIFSPRAVAVVGATERQGSVGRAVMENLIAHFPGPVYAVNGRGGTVLGRDAYAKISDIGHAVDLAVVATPAATVPDIVTECGVAGIGGGIVLSAGFRESGEQGAALERETLRRAREGNVQLIGPNCLGVMNPHQGLNASFAAAMPRSGSTAFLSQSGALCTAVLDWSLKMNVGFSAFVSVGTMADVGWADLLDHFGDDPHTRSILMYIESIGDARAFLSAAREVALSKPVIVIKAGRTEEAAKAAVSHTGAMAGGDAALDAAFRRAGVLRVDTIAELFYMAEILETQTLPRGSRLAVVTNAGGPGVLATDSVIRAQGTLAVLAPETVTELDRHLPHGWSRGNPVDVLGDAGPERYEAAVKLAAADPETDGLLVILTPQSMTDATGTAEKIAEAARTCGKPILASWMGGRQIEEGERVLRDASVPTFPYPDTAARMFGHMWRHAQNLRALYETPDVCPEGVCHPDGEEAVRSLIDAAVARGRTLLTEAESKAILSAYGIPTVEVQSALSEDEAAEAARLIGYPVVAKLLSNVLAHKSDVDGVRLDLSNESEVRSAFRTIERSARAAGGADAFQGVSVQRMVRNKGFELILGSTVDRQLGPVILFGSGGTLAEVIGDRTLELPPLTSALAQQMIERTRAWKALARVYKSNPSALEAVTSLLVRFSQLVVSHPRIREVDINPLLATSSGIIALDARFVLHGPDTPDSELPRSAIRPYPQQYVSELRLKDGTRAAVRPIRPEDEPLIVDFHKTLSERTVYQRYFHVAGLGKRTSHARLTRNCFIDYDRDMALVALVSDANGGRERIVAVGRLIGPRHGGPTTFTLIVADEYQQRGLGSRMLARLLEVARSEGIRHVEGALLEQNAGMARVCRKLGFHLCHDDRDQTILATIDLHAAGVAAADDVIATPEGAGE